MKFRLLVATAVSAALCFSSCQRERSKTQSSVPSPRQALKQTAADTPYGEVKYTSPSDRFQLHALVMPPRSGRAPEAAILLLGDLEKYQDYLDTKDNYSKVWIPSRAGLNYQLLSEGDLWGAWDRCTAEYPELDGLPIYIVGEGAAADAAAQLAHKFRSRFAGLALYGEPRQLNVPNLDYLPVVAYDNTATRFISRLAQRGNAQAASIKGKLPAAIKLLSRSQMKAHALAPYVFSDNEYARAWPWLKVIARRSEAEPVRIEARIEGDTLEILSDNVDAVAIDREAGTDFPEGVRSIRMNGQLYALQEGGSGSVILGEAPGNLNWRRKADTGSGFRDFFDGQATIVVYQDDGAQHDYLTAAKRLAEKLATLRLSGLPQLNVELPLMPLSRYKPSRHPSHRVILIGKHRILRTLVESSPGHLPLPLPGKHKRAYGLIYPPEDRSLIKLSCVLAADNVAGLEALEAHYGKATALGDRSDLLVWSERGDHYVRQDSKIFNSYWGERNATPMAASIPRQSPETWTHFLEELLIQESQARYTILPNLISYRYSMPTQLSTHSLTQWIPERQFAIVTAHGAPSVPALNKLLAASHQGQAQGLQPFLSDESEEPSIDPRKMQRQKNLRILVDYSAIQQLSPEERGLIGYELLPYSLHEVLMRRLKTDKRAFVKDLLRQGTPITPE